jgi:CheY-like chemotaxis protein
LPYHAVPEKKPVIPDSEQLGIANNEGLKLKIIIVEDDEVSEILLKTELETLSNEFFIAKTGTEAIEICQKHPEADLVLMDIRMPEINGYEATRQIRQFNKEIIIIAQTAFGLTGDRDKAIEAGCNDYITKPIKKSELVALIKKYFTK